MFSSKEDFSLASPQVEAEGGVCGEVGKVKEGGRGRERSDGDGDAEKVPGREDELASGGSEATSSLFQVGFFVGHAQRA